MKNKFCVKKRTLILIAGIVWLFSIPDLAVHWY